MNTVKIINSLEKNKPVFQSLLAETENDLITWKPSPEKWCLLEIVCHLYDEEREDFRARVKHTLETPFNPLPPIDPQGWVTSRNYMEWNYEETVKKFLTEREQSVQWLKSLNEPQWKNAYQHPKFGAMSAGMFLSNWLAHDYLHVRQIIKLKFDYLKHISGENLKYAGEW
ncbi:MAG: DinB family protein [Bacteroidota bacterium]